MSSREVAFFTTAARTATPTPAPYDCGYAGGITVVIDVTAITSTPSVTPQVEAFDVRSGKWYALLTGVPVVAVGTTVLHVFPGATPAANVAANAPLTEQVRVTMTHGNANSITYTVSGHLFTL